MEIQIFLRPHPLLLCWILPVERILSGWSLFVLLPFDRQDIYILNFAGDFATAGSHPGARQRRVSVIGVVVVTTLWSVVDTPGELTTSLSPALDCKSPPSSTPNSVVCRPKTGIDGSWGGWGSWSSCGSDCRTSRSRNCDDPSPLFGGQTCQGNSSEKSPSTCYGDDCCPDTSDYLGCHRRYGGASSEMKYFRRTLTPCLCVAYCASLNYSLAGASAGYTEYISITYQCWWWW